MNCHLNRHCGHYELELNQELCVHIHVLISLRLPLERMEIKLDSIDLTTSGLDPMDFLGLFIFFKDEHVNIRCVCNLQP